MTEIKVTVDLVFLLVPHLLIFFMVNFLLCEKFSLHIYVVCIRPSQKNQMNVGNTTAYKWILAWSAGTNKYSWAFKTL